MATVCDVLAVMERLAPARLALDFDKVGLQVGDPASLVEKGVVSLDRSMAAVEFAASVGANLLVAHHPLIFHPLDTVTASSLVGKTVLRLAQAGIAFIAAHTNWDTAVGGVNDELCRLLTLRNVRPFGSGSNCARFKLVFFAPESAVQPILDAISDAGAGQIGLYRRCAFMGRGEGTFLGLEGSNPAAGESGRIEEVEEMRVETVCRVGDRGDVENALRRTHPYEEPAFDWIPLGEAVELPLGRIGELGQPTTLEAWAGEIGRILQTTPWTWGKPDRSIRTVAVVGGAADDEWEAAQLSGADVLLTGEVKQHFALEAVESGFALVAAGHYATEHPGAAALQRRLQREMPEIEWLLFTPESGDAGRPL